MKTLGKAVALTLSILFLFVVPAVAQTARPTPTNIPTGSGDGGGGGNDSGGSARGSIFGAVYYDVNGDGQCVGTGVEGETAVSGVTLQFTSSDGATVIPLTTGEDGTYGLVAAGESYWEVLLLPGSGKTISSQNPLYVPVYNDGTLIHTNVNFCIQNGNTANAVIIRHDPASATNGAIIVPEAGAATQTATASYLFLVAGLAGVLLIILGLGSELRRRNQE